MTFAIAFVAERIEFLHRDIFNRSNHWSGKGVIARCARFERHFDPAVDKECAAETRKCGVGYVLIL